MHSSINKKLILLVFSFFLLVNIASSGGHFDVWDGTETFLVTESMVLKHSAKLYPDIPSVKSIPFDILWSEGYNAGHQGLTFYDVNKIPPLYTVRSLLLSAIAVPFYYAASILSVSPVNVVGLFVNSLIISLTSLVIFCFSFEVYGSRKISFILSLIYGVCSFVFPYHTTLLPQPLQGLTLIASAFFIYKSVHSHQDRFSFICHYTIPNNKNKNNNKGIYYAGLGGLFLGLSVFAHPTSVILIPAFALYSIFSMRHNRKSLASFFIALAITLSFVGLVNYLRFGSFTEFGYGYEGTLSTHKGWTGLVGLLVSPGVGIIFFFPIAVLLPLAFKYMYRENKGLFFLSAYIMFVIWLYVGTISGELFWSGGAWGPRYLIPVLPFITIVSGTLLTHLQRYRSKYRLLMKTSIIALCAAGFFVNLAGTLAWFFYSVMYGFQVWGYHMVMSYYWEPYYSPVILQLKTLMSGYVTHINPEQYISWRFWSSLHQGLAPCPVDVYVFCKFGIAPTILLGAAIAILAAIIITGKDLHISNNNNNKVRSNFLPTINLENFDKIRKITGNVFSRTSNSSNSISRDQK
jgi:hypothetical protein